MDEDALPDDSMMVVFPYGKPILLVKKFGGVYAVSNMCAHMGCTLSRGSLYGLTVRCPCHEWQFDVRDGSFITAPDIRIPTYECKVEEKKIFVKV